MLRNHLSVLPLSHRWQLLERPGAVRGRPGEPVAVRKRDAHEALGQFHVFATESVPTPGPIRVSSQAHFGARKSRGAIFPKSNDLGAGSGSFWECFGQREWRYGHFWDQLIGGTANFGTAQLAACVAYL